MLRNQRDENMFLCSKKKSFFAFALLQDFYVGGHADGQGFILRGPVQALPGGNIGKSPNARILPKPTHVAGGGLEFCSTLTQSCAISAAISSSVRR
ncbi:MAG: hypothetical protein ACLUHE_15565 [Christensenellales bacterium]